MGNDNLERMIQLADEFFETKSDSSQISIDVKTIALLKNIHPSTMTERRTGKGPIAWAMVIPTTHDIMRRFVSKQITEYELLLLTPGGRKYDSLYLCSALVLPEFRKKGYAKRLIVRAVKDIRKDHPIEHLFYWGFSAVGAKLARAIAKEFRLHLHRRKP